MSTKIPIGQILRELASADPDRPCITVGSRTLTRRELDQSSDRLAQGYRTLGVGPGDTVTIALGNSTEMFECCFAIWKLGAVPQPVSGSLPVAERTVIV